ncbi:MAG: flagellar biosynthesis anti-sigma factor FlgM [Lachnospiraceae bacterium]|jgi:negative regulator of flagellin synthesis FlgM|nr:flagellar biosynthesis anti-sigma factor FlgM [Lachnospiraceae bacterium]MCI8985885.1 flagellar biosynthesis anti-sigma factor FlgM [Lachnospiraceae bacterium]MCI9012931.1 flagellar biosynthesis anti-sigma factor FlgM [Lachnospiraceae bacterium]MCI9254185.1 flagellar biosynthesis anti-sigma factor FlgM [Lachnospiraceae bacterium]MDE6902563.1 flagellar biosynthesis anti-sigma factor FlgM [Lachnospiraceae bacterium]
MRIEAYTQVQQLYNATKPAKLQGKAHVSATDRIQISSIGKDIQIAKNAVAAAPDIREDVVAPIRAAVTNGTYQVSAESFAEKLMQKYEEIEGL